MSNICAYRIKGKDGRWSVILADDDSSASQLYQEENKVSEDKIASIDQMDLREKVYNVFIGKPTPLFEIAKIIKFFPRCILDSTDFD